ncbi:dTDP-D-glucose 4,6-dehydratase [Legionella birminghamensis]|uniref:dTDP-glucose 4,6-dehydratase n=2 Tax=Legionella birminghamensis TaxID=28083 RepID=A0A378I6B1_9GAMM|nr:dTDP-glucose 4,6-dehydratase [Legionella birminghamensis]KTC68739.1 dTDP-D-glucose 4,6-dehydratase [Legionella birminghamensis]STX30275.1 dTDP-D-glucose 4,6-dehydratase [Legionella birminghamensis]
MILVTGGSGFIGSNFILNWLLTRNEPVINLDALTYAGNPANLISLKNDPRYQFIHGNICNRELVFATLLKMRPRAIIHMAAESHVDRSIADPGVFLKTNVEGSFSLLDAAYHYWNTMNETEKSAFRFIHVSTDEVYGSLEPAEPAFKETTPYQPNSPYSASKAASDHLARAWFHTYGLPTIITHCSNNYGPFQFPEKLIPLMITRALSQQTLPIYGDGQNIRDWLYVIDHCQALEVILETGVPGNTYNIGGNNEINNLTIVNTLCCLLNNYRPSAQGDYRKLIQFVKDRPGHDKRYAIDSGKIQRELGWKPMETFESGISKTVTWYLENTDWTSHLTNKLQQSTIMA